jgi:hypothetical protein
MEKDLIFAVGMGSTGAISKTMLSFKKGHMGILFGEPIYIHIGKHNRGGHISECAQF